MQEHRATIFTGILLVFSAITLLPILSRAEQQGGDTRAARSLSGLDYKAARIDEPMISTLFGGSGRDGHYETPVVVDGAGHVIMATRTSSAGLPTSPGAFDETLDGSYDLIIAKFSADLSTLLGCTYLGGSNNEGFWPGVDLVLDHQDNLIVASAVTSTDYPTSAGAYCNTLTGSYDIAISRISNDLTTVIASTYLGGSSREWYQKVVILDDGRIAVTGCTDSEDFPTTEGAFDVTFGGGENGRGDVFVSVLDSGLTTLVASTFLGHGGADIPECLVASPTGGYFVGGWTRSLYFPTTPGTVFPTYTGFGYFDGFISHLSDDLTELVASTFIGGIEWDFVFGLALDGSGNVLATGHTASSIGFPVTESAYDTEYSGGWPDVGDDSFILKLTADLETVVAGSYLGGSAWEIGECILVDEEGRIYVAGNTNSMDFPCSAGTFDSTVIPGYQYASDVYVCCFDSDLQNMLFGSILGGNGTDDAGSLAAGSSGAIYIGGATGSENFPTSDNAYDQTYNGGTWEWGGDVFISAFSIPDWLDTDGDGHLDIVDNCPDLPNPDQADADGAPPGDACCCISIRGNANGDLDDLINISDITYLVEYLFGVPLGPAPPCPSGGNANGDVDDLINISDITYLVEYLFGVPLGPAPPACP